MSLLRPRRTSAVRGLAAALALTAGTVVLAPPAGAHPLGNFTINHYHGLHLHPDRVEDTLVVDSAEIAAAQEEPRVDTDGDNSVSAAERAAYAKARCTERAAALTVTVNGNRLNWTVSERSFRYQPGEAGLRTSRLECHLTAPADLAAPAQVQVEDGYEAPRVGWHEMTAQGHGVTLKDSPLATSSVTDALRDYPDDLLAEPLNQRRATFHTAPGGNVRDDEATLALPDLPGTGPLKAAVEEVRQTFHTLVGTRELTLPVGLLALLLAMVLGASHAALPGHGKTIMAAYLASRRGCVRDAVTVGATVTLTHTAGVLVLGLVLPLATNLAGETVLTWLSLVSGLLVTAIGIGLLRGALRGKGPGHHHHHGHHHDGHGHHHGGHGHHHEHDHGPSGNHAHPHPPRPLRGLLPRRRQTPTADSGTAGHTAVAVLTEAPNTPAREDIPTATLPAAPAPPHTSRRGLVGLGIAGGLVPSPSALVVLLGAIALGRTPFGILLVLGYGAGMAATLTAAGVLLVRIRDRLGHSARRRWAGRRAALNRLSRLGPVLTSTLVLTVGLGLTIRALTWP